MKKNTLLNKNKNKNKNKNNSKGYSTSLCHTVCKAIGDVLQRVIVLLIATVACVNPVVSAEEDTVYSIHIPAQSVAQSLSDLSEQTQQMLLFSYDVAENLQANPVAGKYTVPQALNIMLKGTGYSGSLTTKGVLMISLKKLSVTDEKTEGMIDMNTKKKLLASTVAFFVGSGAAQVGVAQEEQGGQGESKFMLEEIVVTAQKRVQNLQDVPISINAFNSEQLEKSGINYVADLQVLAAGIKIGGNNKTPNITIRGVGAAGSNPGFESGTAVHVDGVFLGQRMYLTNSLFDVERIEVLRGPQGTLYGRNATGGAINVITKNPTQDFGYGFSVDLGNYDLIDTESFVNGALNESVSARVSLKTIKRDGYTTNTYRGGAYDDADSISIRAGLLIDINDDATLNMSLDHSRDDGIDIGIHSRLFENTPTVEEEAGGVLANGRRVNYDADERREVDTMGFSARLDWSFSNFNLVSITGYKTHDTYWVVDQGGTQLDVQFTQEQSRDDAKQYSQEINISSASGSSYDWIMGVFYFNESFNEKLDFSLNGGLLELAVPKYDTEVSALFGEVTIPTSDHWSVTLGGRYSYEEKEFDESFGDFVNSFEDDWSSFTPKMTATYRLNSNLMFYGTIAKGFKSGGYNGYSFQAGSYDPEEVINYELGFKGSLIDRTLDVSAGVFYMDYSDLQVEQRITMPGTGIQTLLVTNAADSTIQGLEASFLARPSEFLMLGGNLSYIDAVYDDFIASDNARENEDFDVSGNQLVGVPKYSYTAHAEYLIPVIDVGELSLRAEYSYQSEVFFTPFEDVIDADARLQDSYGIVNASISFTDSSERWRASLYGKNLTDEKVTNFGVTFPPGQLVFLDPPRTYGIKISYSL